MHGTIVRRLTPAKFTACWGTAQFYRIECIGSETIENKARGEYTKTCKQGHHLLFFGSSPLSRLPMSSLSVLRFEGDARAHTQPQRPPESCGPFPLRFRWRVAGAGRRLRPGGVLLGGCPEGPFGERWCP